MSWAKWERVLLHMNGKNCLMLVEEIVLTVCEVFESVI
jgi:hypothetical protein